VTGRWLNQCLTGLGRRLVQYRDRCRRAVLEAIREKHTPHQVGASFAIGIFLTALPTGGLAIGVFVALAALWSWVSKPAMFASVVVLNPMVKPAVYIASFQVGSLLLGSPSVRSSETNAEAAGIALQQLLLGNVIVAVCLSVVGYVLLVWLTRLHRRHARADAEFASASALIALFRRR